MANTRKVTDPADKIKAKQEEARQFDEMKKRDIGSLSMADFKSVPKERARFIHPFDGYPLKPPIVIGKHKGKDVEVSATYIVGLDPKSEPEQDRSGMGMSILNQKTGKEELHDIETVHSRFIRTGPESNEDVVFGRTMVLDGGHKIHYAIVRSHEVRAQIAYYYDSKRERNEVDKRYLWLDSDQMGRLMRLFQLINKPNIRRERMSAEVSGEVESNEDSLGALPTEA